MIGRVTDFLILAKETSSVVKSSNIGSYRADGRHLSGEDIESQAASGFVQFYFLDAASAQNPKTVVIIVLRVRNTTAGKNTKKKFSKSFHNQE